MNKGRRRLINFYVLKVSLQSAFLFDRKDELSEIENLKFTDYCLKGGVALAVVLAFAASPILTPIMSGYLRLFGSDGFEAMPSISRRVDMGFATGMLLLGLLGTAVMWVSAQLDFIVPGANRTGRMCLMAATYCIAVYLGYGIFCYISMHPRETLGDGISVSLSQLFMGVLVLIGGILFLVWIWTFPLATLGFFLGGLLCLPRVIVLLRTTHKLETVWQRGRISGLFHPPDVINALGQKSTSEDHGRALLKRTVELEGEVDAEKAALQREKERLSASIKNDTARIKKEADLATKLAEVEDLRIEIDEMNKFKKERR